MKKKITLIVIAVLLVTSLVVGLSYAYWRHTFVATNVNKIVSSCFNMEITNEKNSITLDDAYPITDEKGKSLTPYSFTITNTCDLFASYTINLEMLEGTTLNSKYVKTMINNEAITNLSTLETTDPSIEGSVESRILFTGSLGSGDSTDYTLRIWMDYDTPNNEESMNKSFQGKITVTAEVSTYSPVENGFTNLAEALLVNEYQTTSLDVAKNKITSKQEVDFSKTAPIIDWQENHATSINSYSSKMLNSNMIGSFNVTDQMTKINVGTGYTFDKSTGYYTLTDIITVDPTTLNYSENTYYVVPNYGFTKNESTKIFNYYSSTNGTSIYKITSATKIDGKASFSDGTSYENTQYTINGYLYTQTDLESDKSDKGLYQMQDDHGTSYYYRGLVNNNYVKFGGYYWRVIRINGDGSIRLLYAGNSATASGAELTTGNKFFNSQRNNPAYVGYMYGSVLNTSLVQTNANEVDSTIKQQVDEWYKSSFVDTGYSKYIADSGFCGDRSIVNGTGYNSTSTTNYSGETRYSKTKQPILNCPNESDLYTTSTASFGNKSLTYPVGLITLDELMISGLASGYINRMSYTYSSEIYWTMTPNFYSENLAYCTVYAAEPSGYVKGSILVASALGVRPVINLKADTEISSGIGTKNDPFIIK